MAIILNPIEYFATKFQVKSSTECWPWKASCDNGYGTFKTKLFKGERRAHRIMWLFQNGPIPEGMHVLHKCDNPPCVNPNHLFLGTDRDNANDRDMKGRGCKGRPSSRRLFPDEELEAMRKMRDEGFSLGSIGKQFHCCKSTVLSICRDPNHYNS